MDLITHLFTFLCRLLECLPPEGRNFVLFSAKSSVLGAVPET